MSDYLNTWRDNIKNYYSYDRYYRIPNTDVSLQPDYDQEKYFACWYCVGISYKIKANSDTQLLKEKVYEVYFVKMEIL